MRVRRLEEHERRRAEMRRDRDVKRSPPARRFKSRSPLPKKSRSPRRSPRRSGSTKKSRSPRRPADRRDKSRSASPKK